MRQTRSVILGGASRARKINDFRRRAWVQRRVYLRRVETPVIEPPHEYPAELSAEHWPAREYIPGEYPEPPKSKVIAGLRRGVGLLSDLVVLLLAPFFGLWLIYRAIVRTIRGKK